MRTVRFAAAGAVLGILLTGCFSLSKGYPEKRYYVLQAGANAGSPPPAQVRTVEANGPKGDLRVARFRISPLYEGKEFVYRNEDLGYESDFYNVFFIPPASLITEEVRRWLAASGSFRNVMDPGSHAAGGLLLEGVVSSLYGDFRDAKKPRACLEIQAMLLRNDAEGAKVSFKKDYREETALPEPSPAALARGWNEGLEKILTALEADLRTAASDGGK